MTRLAGYVAATLDHCHIMQVQDGPSEVSLFLYADVNFRSAPDMKSTSGYFLTLEVPQSFVLLLWCSQRQRMVSISTTEVGFAFNFSV